MKGHTVYSNLVITAIFMLITLTYSHSVLSATKPRIAVMTIRSIATGNYLGEASAELLRTRLINDGRFIVVERALLQKIAHEQKLQMSGLVSTKTAVRIGRLVGANYIIVGSIMKLGSKLILSVRLIDVQTAISKRSAEVRGSSEDDLDSMCAEALQQLFPQTSSQTNRPPSSSKKKKNTKKPSYIPRNARSVSSFLKPYKDIVRGLEPSAASMLSKFARDGLSLAEKRFIIWLAANDPKKQLSIALKYSMKGKITDSDVKKLPNPTPIDDMFTDNHNKWALGETGSGKAYLQGGYFYTVSNKSGYFNWFTPQAANTMISKYRGYICKTHIASTNYRNESLYYGVIFRAQDVLWSYFFLVKYTISNLNFSVNSNGDYIVQTNGNYSTNIGIYNGGSWRSLTNGWKKVNIQFSTLIVSSIENKIKAYLSDGTHKTLIFQTTNSLFPYGKVGIAAGGRGEVRFSSFKVYISKTELWRKAHLY